MNMQYPRRTRLNLRTTLGIGDLEKLNRAAINIDAKPGCIGDSDYAALVLDRRRQNRLTEWMFGAVELEQRFQWRQTHWVVG